MNKMLIRKKGAVKPEAIPVGQGASRQVLLGPGEEMPNYFLRRFAIEPGGHIPYHTNTVEHEQYVLEGEAELIVDGEKHRVEAGDSLFLPANVLHSYRTLGDKPFVFLCIVPNALDRMELKADS